MAKNLTGRMGDFSDISEVVLIASKTMLIINLCLNTSVLYRL